jgi:hypothetical protein
VVDLDAHRPKDLVDRRFDRGELDKGLDVGHHLPQFFTGVGVVLRCGGEAARLVHFRVEGRWCRRGSSAVTPGSTSRWCSPSWA